MDDGRKCVDDLAGKQDVQLDQLGLPVADQLVVHGRVALGPALELVEEIGDEFRERNLVGQLGPVGAEVFHVDEYPTLPLR
ncbi:hypothetical protein D3C87_1885990 [compost metagenome]